MIDATAKFAPVVDGIMYWTFVFRNTRKPGPEDRIWPGCDHPYINQVREVHKAAGETPVYPIILPNWRDAPSSHRRRAIFEEIQWQILAEIGAGSRGILWRGTMPIDELPYANKLKQFTASILVYADDLGEAKIVDWFKVDQPQPVAALRSRTRLFLVLLNPNYMASTRPNGDPVVPLDARHRGTLRLTPPSGIKLSHAKSISSSCIRLEDAGNHWVLHYEFDAGGDMVIFDLEERETSGGAASQPRNP